MSNNLHKICQPAPVPYKVENPEETFDLKEKIGEYLILGEGNYGKVYRGVHKQSC